jgi:serine/threonine protein kinase
MVVRKRMKKISRRSVEAENKAFREELNCLKLLCRSKHPNIVELLGAYTFNSDNNLLFRHFEMDLDAFLSLEERFGDFIYNHTFFNALHGLSSALSIVHNLRLNAQDHDVELSRIGYHHDLRPANILVSKSTFLLADFGLAKMKSEEDTSKTTYKAGGGDYLAPECMSEDYTRQPIGRAADIWSLGCTIIEVLSYIERGSEGVKELKRRRRGPSFDPRCEDHYYFGIDELKVGVLGWLKEIQIGCTTKLIPDLTRVSLSALQIDPENRPRAGKMSQGLMWVNIKHYYLEVQEALDLYLRYTKDETSRYQFSMKMWFVRERFNSWGWVLNILLDEPDELFTHIIEKIGPDARERMSSILDILRRENAMPEQDTEEDGAMPSEDAEEVVGQLVQDLWELIPLHMQRRLETVWRNMMLESTDQSSLLKIVDFASSVDLRAYAEIRALAAMKAIDNTFPRTTALATHNHRLVAEAFQRQHSLGHHEIGTYEGTKVLVEWIHYSPLWEDVSADERSLRLQMLAEGISQHPRPPDLRILDCIGFIETSSERHGCGFLYTFPHPVAIPITLQSFLQRGRASIDKQPTLGTKLRMANALVRCMVEFHNIGWLHKNFHSGNIIFFCDDPLVSALERGPYLIDLRTSRPDSEEWYSEPPVYDHTTVLYQHPDYQKINRGDPKRYRAEFDYYSLGCVLLEIGSWQPLKDLWDNNPGISPNGFRNLLINKYAPRLAPRVGRSYANVVIFCLEGLLDRDETERGDLYRQVYDKILVPLEEISGYPL